MGGAEAGQRNVISDNTVGVDVSGGEESRDNAAVLGNSIHSNGGLGIDLVGEEEAWDTVTPNDPLDADEGPNGLQNHPAITVAATDGKALAVTGELMSEPDSDYALYFYANEQCDADSPNGEGEEVVGMVFVATDGGGVAAFEASLSAEIEVGSLITATATRIELADEPGGPLAFFSTSELSACVGGNPFTPEECAAELGNEAPCLTGTCAEPDGCALVPLADGDPCALPGAALAQCEVGQCEVGQCEVGQCEVGQCEVVSCAAGFDDCDAAPGCETDTREDPANCGACGAICGRESACVAGECAAAPCEDGDADCDGDPGTVCETHLRSDVEHCGACGAACRAMGRFENGLVACLVNARIAGEDAWTLDHVTVAVPAEGSGPAVKMGRRNDGGGWRIVDSLFLWLADVEQPYHAIEEATLAADPAIVRNNAFVGFGGPNGSVYLDETDTRLNDVRRLDILPELAACGRGDNLAFDDPAAAGIASTDPNSADFLRLAPGSPLIDRGLGRVEPFECDGQTIARLVRS